MSDKMSHDKILYERLREKRNEIAQKEGVKPYMVFQNKVLEEISEKKPESLADLTQVKGMGPKKMARYGQLVLEMVNHQDDEGEEKEAAGEKIYTVAEFLDQVNQLLSPQKAIVQGEISQVKVMNNYAFFTLADKNKEAVLNCFVWQNKLESFGAELKEGLELRVEGFAQVFKRNGRFSFEVERLGLVGEGALKQAFENLKRRLAEAGFFLPQRKKPLPAYVGKIGLITSSYGDAKNDFLTHLGKFGFKVYFYNVRVEGLYAVEEIAEAIRYFNENETGVDVLVLTRGGGSLESLQPFNSEELAKAIFASKIPIITAIGHENNRTIADLVADVYASTPTDAARIISDPWRQAGPLLISFEDNMTAIIRQKCSAIGERLSFEEENFSLLLKKAIDSQKSQLENRQKELFFSFERIINKFKTLERSFSASWGKLESQLFFLRQKIALQEAGIFQESGRWLGDLRERLENVNSRLSLSDPRARLKQGYSIILDKERKIIRSSRQIEIGDKLWLKFYEGEATGRVEKKK